MSKFTPITQDEMADFLAPMGFLPILLPGVSELVYARRQDHDGLTLTLRVFTGIDPNGQSRDKGTDAIRVVLFWRQDDGTITKVATSKRVHRVEGWRKNLASRIESIAVGPLCTCGSPMVERKRRALTGCKSTFYGCARFPVCRETRNA